ncbi:MAG: DUF2254 domain-containing protein [Gammaproteobacteria bacterium]|nr:DUF2254 domain-containing protein [Gammaproteobacteria bacterium]
MKTYLVNLWDSLRSSFWFVPAMFGVVALLVAIAMPMLDASLQIQHPAWLLTTTDAARATLSTIVGAMMGITGTVFSITIVILSLTSQQFGPRLLRTFMLDLPTQVSMGVFLSTGVYCLLILRVVEDSPHGPGTPHASVALAVVLIVLSMGVLIYFIHHVAVMIQAPNVVALVAQDLDNAIVRLFPERIGEDAGKRVAEGPGAQQLADAPARVVSCTALGYVQAVDDQRLMTIAVECDLRIHLHRRPGHFVSTGIVLADLWYRGGTLTDEAWSDIERRINDCLIVGVRSTPRQDVECAIGELVELAVRALSPGINDPFTAVTCVDYLGSAMAELAQRQMPDPRRVDDEGILRVVTWSVDFDQALDTAFNQIRQYGAGSPAVLIRMLEVFAVLGRQVSRQQHRQSVLRHAALVEEAAVNAVHDSNALAAIRARHQAI